MKVSRFWDVIVVREDGEWMGFRTPWKSLRRVATYFSVTLIVCILSLAGWLLSRWQVERLQRNWGFERLKSSALEAQLNDLRNSPTALAAGHPIAGATGAPDTGINAFSLIPSLDADELSSAGAELSETAAEFDPTSKELEIKFELVRKPPREGSARFYWVALLHGPQGMLSLPPTLASRHGDAILFHRGQPLDEVKIRRSVNARYKIEGFIERAETDPLFVSLMVYDSKGSLMLRRRMELFIRRASSSSGAR